LSGGTRARFRPPMGIFGMLPILGNLYLSRNTAASTLKSLPARISCLLSLAATFQCGRISDNLLSLDLRQERTSPNAMDCLILFAPPYSFFRLTCLNSCYRTLAFHPPSIIQSGRPVGVVRFGSPRPFVSPVPGALMGVTDISLGFSPPIFP